MKIADQIPDSLTSDKSFPTISAIIDKLKQLQIDKNPFISKEGSPPELATLIEDKHHKLFKPDLRTQTMEDHGSTVDRRGGDKTPGADGKK
jgi:hypothetical protein